jgi:hypothetical protein
MVIESLRGGVPSPAVVQALGTDQQEIEQEFRQLATRVSTELTPGYLFIRGEFGAGKSHLLMALREVAHELRLCTAFIAVSKETPISQPRAIASAIAANLTLPNRVGRGLFSAWANHNTQSKAWTAFDSWALTWSPGDGFWYAMVRILARARTDDDILDESFRFIAGDRTLTRRKVDDALREFYPGERFAGTKPPTPAEQYWQGIAFLSRLTRGLGFGGLVVFVDEVELLAEFTQPQRAKAYLNLAKLTGLDGSQELRDAPILVVGALTNDFKEVVLEKKGDLHAAPARLESSEHDACSKAMQALLDARSLRDPTEEMVAATRERIAQLYAAAYPGFTPRAEGPILLFSTTSMRELIRRWITAWDLERYYGPVELAIETESIGATPTEEDAALEDEPD